MEKIKIVEFLGYPGSGKTTIAKGFVGDIYSKHFHSNTSLGLNNIKKFSYLLESIFRINKLLIILYLSSTSKINFIGILRLFLSYNTLIRKQKDIVFDQGILNFLVTAGVKNEINFEQGCLLFELFLMDNFHFIKVNLDHIESEKRLKGRKKYHYLDKKDRKYILNYYSSYDKILELYINKYKLNILNLDGSLETKINKNIIVNYLSNN